MCQMSENDDLSENVGNTPKPNGFADHYPVFKWLFYWEYTLFSEKPKWWFEDVSENGMYMDVPWFNDVAAKSCKWQSYDWMVIDHQIRGVPFVETHPVFDSFWICLDDEIDDEIDRL